MLRLARFLLATGALLALAVVALPARAQTWEMLPLLPLTMPQSQSVNRLGFLRAEGDAALDPSLDSLILFKDGGSRLFLYNPSGAAGSAGDNGLWGAWHALCGNCPPEDGLVTSSNSILIGNVARPMLRSTNRGRTWNRNVDSLYATPLFESALPSLVGPDGQRGIVAVLSDAGHTRISRGDGAPGTWTPAGVGLGTAETLFDVPPSPALPTGRLLMGVWNGVSGSTDGGMTYEPTSLYGGYIGLSFALMPQEGHPYGGIVFVAVLNTAYQFESVELYRSDDGGAVWALVHRFTGEETGLPLMVGELTGYPIGDAALAALPDGTLYAAPHYRSGPTAPGVIMRSTDLGLTWTRSDDGFTGYFPITSGNYPPSTPEQPFGWRVRSFALARDGRLYAATDYSVWRTTQPVVSSEAWPTPMSTGLRLTARPNPASGAVTLSLSSERAERVRVEVVDASGRVVHEAVEVWATPSGTELRLPSERWAAGVYVARGSVGRHTEHVTARFTVVR